MTFDSAFSLASLVAVFGWLLLVGSPLIPKWSALIAGTFLPLLLSLGYFVLVLIPSDQSGSFGSLEGMMELFSNEQAVLAGWVHFLAFDLIIGAWACRTARGENIRFALVLPCLPLIFLLGPVGFLAFQGVRFANRMKQALAGL